MDNPEAARQQAWRENNWNQGPSNTNGWDYSARIAYEAERERIRKQQEDANKQQK
jgi:hypothetical protein